LLAVASNRVAFRPTRQTAAPVEAIAEAIAPPIAELAPDITAFSSGPISIYSGKHSLRKAMKSLHNLETA
jgi:hypothetical protein